MAAEQEKAERLETIARWENPGPGSFYDSQYDVDQANVLEFVNAAPCSTSSTTPSTTAGG